MSKDTCYIKALGSLLNYYESDLEFIAEFQKAKSGSYNDDYPDSKNAGSFKAFINEYGVARNISSENSENTKKLLDLILSYVEGADLNNVDGLAIQIRNAGITPKNRIPVSLASKVLMLNNPWEILPMDNQTCKSLKYSGALYSEYKVKLDSFIEINKVELLTQLAQITHLLIPVESKFKEILRDIETIRFNRYVDKVLWTGNAKFNF